LRLWFQEDSMGARKIQDENEATECIAKMRESGLTSVRYIVQVGQLALEVDSRFNEMTL
jgi:hypothetical protein